MSHKATNWAIEQRGLKPAVKLLLWHLCDRHHPDNGCFPSQETLADDCEMARSSINRHLDELERLGLLRRERRVDPQKRRQKSTRYIFAFEDDFGGTTPPEAGGGAPSTGPSGGGATETAGVASDGHSAGADVQKPCLNLGHGAVSQKQQKPCPKKRKSRVSNWDTNPVREPVMNQRAKTAVRFFTADERFEAKEIAERFGAGGKVVWGAVPKRVAECLVADGLIAERDAKLLGLNC